MFDPLLLHSPISKYREIGFLDKVKQWNTANVWFNFILPIVGILIMAWFIKIRYEEKKELYQEYVPPKFNNFVRF